MIRLNINFERILWAICGWILAPVKFGRDSATSLMFNDSLELEDHNAEIERILDSCDCISMIDYDNDPTYLIMRDRTDPTIGYKIWIANRWYAVGTTLIEFRTKHPIHFEKMIDDGLEYCHQNIIKERKYHGAISYSCVYRLYKLYNEFRDKIKKGAK